MRNFIEVESLSENSPSKLGFPTLLRVSEIISVLGVEEIPDHRVKGAKSVIILKNRKDLPIYTSCNYETLRLLIKAAQG